MSEITERLLELKESAEEAERKFLESKGRIDAAEEALKDEFNLTSIAAAEKRVTQLTKKIQNLEEDLEKELEEIEKDFPWED